MPQARTPEDVAALLRSLDKEDLVRIVMDDAKNWLAHDLWCAWEFTVPSEESAP